MTLALVVRACELLLDPGTRLRSLHNLEGDSINAMVRLHGASLCLWQQCGRRGRYVSRGAVP